MSVDATAYAVHGVKLTEKDIERHGLDIENVEAIADKYGLTSCPVSPMDNGDRVIGVPLYEWTDKDPDDAPEVFSTCDYVKQGFAFRTNLLTRFIAKITDAAEEKVLSLVDNNLGIHFFVSIG